jgi:hypothetical protein
MFSRTIRCRLGNAGTQPAFVPGPARSERDVRWSQTLIASISEQASFLLAEFVIGEDSRVAQGGQFT